mgnify:CR=1 FL=1
MKKLLPLWLAVLLLSGCETFSQSSKIFNKIFSPKTNSRYYEKKARYLVDQLIRQMEEETSNLVINKVAVLDLVDHTGRVPE